MRHNNLKNITVQFPQGKLTVVTGLSGSGKSSLAFETLYAEGQRRYVESLSTYTRQFLEKMPKPDLDQVENIPPAIALEQRNRILNSRSTVGTQTEILDYLRLLYGKVGTTFCPKCNVEVKSSDPQSITDFALKNLPGRKALILAPIGPIKTKNVLEIIRGQGFPRVALYRAKAKGTAKINVIDLEEMESAFAEIKSGIKKGAELFVVLDRLKLERDLEPVSESSSRLLDSIEQALMIGHQKVAFADIETGWLKIFEAVSACPNCGDRFKAPDPQMFSFNSPLGACARCSGFGFNLELDESLIVPDPHKRIKYGAIDPLSKPSLSDWQKDLFTFCKEHSISTDLKYSELTRAQRDLLWKGAPQHDAKAGARAGTKSSKKKGFPGILGCFEELKKWKYKLHVRVFIRRYQVQSLCPECKGARLKPESLWVKISERNISEVQNLPLDQALEWLKSITLTRSQQKIAAEPLSQVERRLSCLVEVGVGYLTLARIARTLSGGEFQRLGLATQIGNGLCGTLYVLDEPSIGLHATDTSKLLKVLKKLRDQGNTVVVVEHDLEMISHADWIVELGPGAGRRGGEIVVAGPIATCSDSLTGKYLSGQNQIARTRGPSKEPKRWIKVTGCRENNLKGIDLNLPLDRFVVVTGVSGSGKSTLIDDTLYKALLGAKQPSAQALPKFDKLYGADQISSVLMLDQAPIGKSSRSNPATYMKAWDEIRRIYSNQSLSMRRGYLPQHFSFNVDGGRCPVCKGEGEVVYDMHFMADLKLPCEECEGRKFKKAVLDVQYRGKNVHELLQSTVQEVYELFRDHPVLAKKLTYLREVGLGYLQFGQSATTLSGGESQRLKIAGTLDQSSGQNLLYIFDEPTTGLHLEDVKKLLGVLHDLVAARHSVVVIEHHLDVIRTADWIIDLGPGGGDSGGTIVYEGPPETLVSSQVWPEKSLTARALVDASRAKGQVAQ